MQTLFAIYQGRARLSLARSARSLRRGAPDEMARPYRRSRRRLIVFSTETLSGLIDTPPATMGLPARRGGSSFLKAFSHRIPHRSRSNGGTPNRGHGRGERGRASGQYRPSRSGRPWCGHHQQGLKPPHPRTDKGIYPLVSPARQAQSRHGYCPNRRPSAPKMYANPWNRPAKLGAQQRGAGGAAKA